MPRTLCKSSTDRNGPSCLRDSTIRFASVSPMRGRADNSGQRARFTFKTNSIRCELRSRCLRFPFQPPRRTQFASQSVASSRAITATVRWSSRRTAKRATSCDSRCGIGRLPFPVGETCRLGRLAAANSRLLSPCRRFHWRTKPLLCRKLRRSSRRDKGMAHRLLKKCNRCAADIKRRRATPKNRLQRPRSSVGPRYGLFVCETRRRRLCRRARGRHEMSS